MNKITNRDKIKRYLADIRNYPILSMEEQHALYELYLSGDEKAKDRLIQSNLRLVISIAKKYCGQYDEIDEFIAAGNLGMILALDKFDSTRGNIISYFNLYIQRQMITHINENNKTIRTPVNRLKSNRMIDEQIANGVIEIKYENERDEEHYNNPSRNEMYSLDMTVADETYLTYADTIECEEYPTEYDNSQEHLKAVLGTNITKLKPSYQEVVRMHYFEGMTLSEVAKELKMSRENIRQIHNKLLLKLKELLVNEK